jgi:hypothetical protein
VPVAFRSGRWGYNAAVAGNLERLGYTIDTSVTPSIDWAPQRGPDFRAAAPGPYRFTLPDILSEAPAGALVEVPATIGVVRFELPLTNRAVAAAARAALGRPRLGRLLSRLRILNTIWLSPELSTGRDMIRLARTLVRKGCPLLNMVFHSSALQAGLTPFVKDVDDERRFRARLREFLAFTRAEGIEPMRLSAVKTLL